MKYFKPLCLFLICVLYLPLLDTLPFIAMDEPAYAATAWQFFRGHGFINPVWVGGGQEFFLYPFFLALSYKVLGVSLWSSRLVSVVMALLSGWMLLKIAKQWSWKTSTTCLVLATFFINNSSYIIFRSCRPESMVALGLLTSIWLFSNLLLGKKTWGMGLALGLVSTLCILAHPIALFGTVFWGIALCYDAYSRKSARVLWGYITGILCIISLWGFVYIGIEGHTLKELFSSLNERTHSTSRWALAQANLLRTYRGYSLGLKRFFLWGCELSILGVGLYTAWSKKAEKSPQIIGLMLLSLFGLGFFGGMIFGLTNLVLRYFSLISIFSCLVLGMVIENKKSKCLIGIAIFYCAYSLMGQLWVIHRQWDATPYSVVEKQLSQAVPTHEPVMTNLQFWFPFYQHLVITDTLACAKEDTLTYFQSGKVHYVVLADFLLKKESPTTGFYAPFMTSKRWELFYEGLFPYLQTHGQLASTVSTKGYGDIQVWKVSR